MKLYVCYGTFPVGYKKHPCREADKALREAGYDPEVIKTYGFGAFPMALNGGRKPVVELTGQKWVPALEFDDGTGISGTKNIIAWAAANPAGVKAAAAV
jgi:hypothetical protein